MNVCYENIIDDSLQPTYTNPSIAAFVAGVQRGPVGAAFVPSIKRRKLLYGVANPAWSYGIDSIDAFLLQGNEAWFNRVVASDAKYALGLIANNTLGGTPAGTSFTRIPYGSTVAHDQLNIDVIDVEFTGLFVAATSVTLTINGETTASIPFDVNHNQTMSDLAQAAQNLLDADGAGGLAWLVPNPRSPNTQVLRLISPLAITLEVSAITEGAGAPTVTTYEADWLAFVESDNPGNWGDGVAAGILNMDRGTPQRTTISLSTTLTSGNTISATINGITFSAAYSLSSNSTLTAFIAAYAAAFPGGSGSLIANGSSNALQFVLIAPDSLTNLAITTLHVTGGSAVLLTSQVTLTNVPTTNSFNFVVYEKSTFAVPTDDGAGGHCLGRPDAASQAVARLIFLCRRRPPAPT